MNNPAIKYASSIRSLKEHGLTWAEQLLDIGTRLGFLQTGFHLILTTYCEVDIIILHL